jgi:hypothetical protein
MYKIYVGSCPYFLYQLAFDTAGAGLFIWPWYNLYSLPTSSSLRRQDRGCVTSRMTWASDRQKTGNYHSSILDNHGCA